MKFLFSTGSLYTYSTERCFDIAARAGFDGIEIMVDARWDTRQPSHLRMLMSRYALPIVTIHSPFGNVPGWGGGQPALIAQSVSLAESVGAKIVVHHLPAAVSYVKLNVGQRRMRLPLPGRGGEVDYQHWLLDGYAQLQAKTDITLCIENMPARQLWGRPFNGHRWNSVDEIQRFPALTMDTTHLGTWGLEPVDVYAQWGQRVRHIHLSNFDGREHRLPEDGVLHLDQLLTRLVAEDYQGATTFELQTDSARAGAKDGKIIHILSTSLTLCRDWVIAPDSVTAKSRQ